MRILIALLTLIMTPIPSKSILLLPIELLLFILPRFCHSYSALAGTDLGEVVESSVHGAIALKDATLEQERDVVEMSVNHLTELDFDLSALITVAEASFQPTYSAAQAAMSKVYDLLDRAQTQFISLFARQTQQAQDIVAMFYQVLENEDMATVTRNWNWATRRLTRLINHSLKKHVVLEGLYNDAYTHLNRSAMLLEKNRLTLYTYLSKHVNEADEVYESRIYDLPAYCRNGFIEAVFGWLFNCRVNTMAIGEAYDLLKARRIEATALNEAIENQTQVIMDRVLHRLAVTRKERVLLQAWADLMSYHADEFFALNNEAFTELRLPSNPTLHYIISTLEDTVEAGLRLMTFIAQTFVDDEEFLGYLTSSLADGPDGLRRPAQVAKDLMERSLAFRPHTQ